MGDQTKCVERAACAPLVKWPGGKRLLLKHILALIIPHRAYFEPFLGGGALFFALQTDNATLADNNPELINAYAQVRDNCDAVISSLRRLKNSKEDYYHVRDSHPRTELSRAVRFLYLSRLSFNGIHRTNLRGEFNVPYGFKTHLSTCDPVHLRSASKKLKHAKLTAADFEDCVRSAGAGDLVYLDPPYTVAHGNNGFLKYNAKIFRWEDQVRLARTARMLAERHCQVIVSNANHKSIRALYPDFQVRVIARYSIMAANSHHRRAIQECLFFNEAKSHAG